MNILKNIHKQSSLQKPYVFLKAAVFALALGTWHTALSKDLPAGNRPESVIDVTVQDIARTDNDVRVSLLLDLTNVKMKSNVETVYTPMFVNGPDTVRLTSFAVTGRNRKYWDQRNDQEKPITFYKNAPTVSPSRGVLDPMLRNIPLEGGKRGAWNLTPGNNLGAWNLTPGNNLGTWNLALGTPYQPWLDEAFFTIEVQNYGCADCLKDYEGVEPYYALAQNDLAPRVNDYMPDFIFVTPVAEAVKMREISARAYIDFPVNQTVIYPDYRRNPEELAKIRATIDSVENDKDITVKSLHISGTASPEGPYDNNVRLAKGRTEALKQYVQGLYHFPEGFITTSYEPVDWTGLAEWLESSEGRNRLINWKAILDIVNGDLAPYARNQKIKTTYPKDYAWLLKNIYPALRHSDYRIQFEIKTFTDISEILEVMQTQPQKLSLNELFMAANSQPVGSDLYNRAFELAVTMFPESEIANLNAGVAAMQNSDLSSAERFIGRAGNLPEALYSKGILMILQGDRDGALSLFELLTQSDHPEVSSKSKAAVEDLTVNPDDSAKHFRPIDTNEE